MTKLNAKELRVSQPSEEDLKKVKRNPIYFILDRIIDTYNIGSLFRLADAIASEKMYLCGEMEYPPSIKIHRAAVGTEAWVPWEKSESTIETVKKLKRQGVQIIAIEQDKDAISYKNLTPPAGGLKFPCAIISGNETEGLPKEVLKEADIIVELPMFGINKSFNVWGSTAVVTYKVIESIK
jgi:tRNA G18 (ribose-2'-O)-methylase SpoU